MTRIRPAFRAAAALLTAGLSTACIIETSDDAGQDGTDTSDDLPPGDDGVDDGVDDDGTGDGMDDGMDDGIVDDGTTGGELPGECTENVVADPGFEGGPGSAAWDQASLLFDTPICDTTSCSDDKGAVPHDGDFWAWFGGSETEPEVASLAQSITIPAGDVARLSLWVQIPSGAGSGDDFLRVSLDEQMMFIVTDLDMPEYESYRRVDIDVTDFADGASHDLLIEADITGVALTSFFVDDVSVVSCSEGGSDSTGDSGTSTGADDTAGTSDGSDTSSGSDSGSESDSGSSSSG